MATKAQRERKHARRTHHNRKAHAASRFDLSTLTVAQLKTVATKVGLSGISRLTKNELIGALTPFGFRKADIDA